MCGPTYGLRIRGRLCEVGPERGLSDTIQYTVNVRSVKRYFTQ